MNKLPIKQTLIDGCTIGLKNFPSLLGVVCLYVLTVWIPYLNVGTTIAMKSIPVELSKGNIINPLFIFDKKYRRNMGEFFIIVGLMAMAQVPAYMLGILPGIVLNIAWSLAIYLFIDKNATALEALRQSNDLTYGYKWRIFGLGVIFGVAISVVTGIISGIFNAVNLETLGGILVLIISLVSIPVALGLESAIYRNLTAEPQAEEPAEEKAEEQTEEKAEEKTEE